MKKIKALAIVLSIFSFAFLLNLFDTRGAQAWYVGQYIDTSNWWAERANWDNGAERSFSMDVGGIPGDWSPVSFGGDYLDWMCTGRRGYGPRKSYDDCHFGNCGGNIGSIYAQIIGIDGNGVATVRVILDPVNTSAFQSVYRDYQFQANIDVYYGAATVFEGVTNSTDPSDKKADNVHSLAKETDTAEVLFHHAIWDDKGLVYLDNIAKLSKIRTYIDDKLVDTKDNSTHNTWETAYVPLAYGESKKVCQEADWSPTSAKFTSAGSYISSSGSSVTSRSCTTVYREAETYVGLTTKISSTVTKNLTTPSSNQSAESHINKDSTSSSVVIGNPDKIFMDSSANDATKKAEISFDYTLTRGDPNTTYDASKTITANYTINGIAGSVDLDSPTSSKTVNTNHTLCNGSGSGCDEVISLGTYDRQVCRTLITNSTYLIGYNGNIGSVPLTAEACAHVYRPYNFNLTPSASVNDGSDIFLGATVEVDARVSNSTNGNQEGTHSFSPEGTQVKVVRFVVNRATSADYIKENGGRLFGGTSGSGDICAYYTGKLGTSSGDTSGMIQNSCKTIYEEALTNGVSVDGFNKSISDIIPNDSGYEVGDKVCYATAVQYVNSSAANSTSGIAGYGSMNPNAWIFSNASCQATAKRPTFHVLGGSVFGEGSILGTVTKTLENSNYRAYGSWVDFGVLSNSKISKVASGASLAKDNIINSSSSNVNFCDYSPLTVANKDCTNRGDELGFANVEINTTTLNNLLNRFADNPNADKISGGMVNLSAQYTAFLDKYFTKRGTGNYHYTYIDGDGTIAASSILTKGITHVVYSSGKITIDSDLAYEGDNLTSVAEIPQYIIIAKGGISINENVERVDAWLVAHNSTINTCAVAFEESAIGSDKCTKQLNVNGPVFAKNMLLYRTYGAEPSNPSLAAENFDMNAATYFWARYQAKYDISQANTVYTKRLAPRS